MDRRKHKQKERYLKIHSCVPQDKGFFWFSLPKKDADDLFKGSNSCFFEGKFLTQSRIYFVVKDSKFINYHSKLKLLSL